MNNQSSLDRQISRALHNEGDSIYASVDLKERIDEQIEQQSGDIEMVNIRTLSAHRNKERTMRKLNKAWIAAAAIAACILIPTGVYAAGQITGYVSGTSLGQKSDSYDDIAKMQEKLGFTFKSLENFSNGYAFSHMDTSSTDKLDESNHRVGSFEEWWGYYEMEGAPRVTLIVHEVQPEAADYEKNPTEQRDINGITVSYTVDHYKFVPVDYEMTAEDEENAEKPHYYISVGSDQVEELDYTFTTWDADGISYSLMCENAALSTDEFFAMAEELIQQQ